MKTLIMCAAMGACLPACAPIAVYPTHYQVYVDPAFGNRVDDVLHALDIWVDAVHSSGADLQFDVMIRDYKADVGDYAIISIHPDTIADIDAKNGGPNFIGATVYYDPYMGWGDSYIEQTFAQWTILHELGHALGLSHRGAGVVMCKDIDCGVPVVTCEDANQYRTLRGMSEKSCNGL